MVYLIVAIVVILLLLVWFAVSAASDAVNEKLRWDIEKEDPSK